MEQALGIDVLFRAIEVGHVPACRGRSICKFFHDHISIIKLQHKQNASSKLFWRTAPGTALRSVIASGLITPAMLPEHTLYVVAGERNVPAVVEALDDHGLLAPDAVLQELFEQCIHRASLYTDRNSYQFRIEKVLLARYPAINPGSIRNMAMRAACGVGDAGMVALLLADARVDPAANRNDAFRRACECGHADVVRMLLADARVDPADGFQLALGMSVVNGHTDVVRLLLSDARVDPRFVCGTIVITTAIERGHIEVLQLVRSAIRARFNAAEGVKV